MNKILSRKRIGETVEQIFGTHEHQRRKSTMTDIIYGILYSQKLSITWVGRSVAFLLQVSPKHCIKRVDRFLGNHLVRTEMLIDCYARWLTERRRSIVVSLDWTEYGKDRQHRLAVNLVTSHGRATPLLWKTYGYGEIRNKRSYFERAILRRLKTLLPDDCAVTVLADRGFIDAKMMRMIRQRLKWDYVIRLRSSMTMRVGKGRLACLSTYLPRGNRAVIYNDVLLTGRGNPVPSVVIVKDPAAKEPWYLASSIAGSKEIIIALYRKRFTCEEQFRDEKDPRFGLGTTQTRFSTCARRDRLLLVNAIATVLLTVLGAVGEKLGYDRQLRANTARKRTHSLFRQGKEYLKGVMPDYVRAFSQGFTAMLKALRVNSTTYAIC